MQLPEFQLDPATVPVEKIPALIAALAARLLVAPSPALPTPSASENDVMLEPDEAAAMLKKDRRWLSRNRRRLPFVKQISPRCFVCSKNGLLKWLASRKA